MNKRRAGNVWLALSVATVVVLGMAPAAIDPGGDPLVGFHYALSSGGATLGYFTEIDGIGSESEIVEQKVVTDKGMETVLKVPGRVRFLDVSLKRGITATQDLWTWRALVEAGNVKDARKNVSVILYDNTLAEVAQWDLTNAWPSKVVQSNTAAGTGSAVIEQLTLVNEGYQRIK
jgi:phage tail-like protein